MSIAAAVHPLVQVNDIRSRQTKPLAPVQWGLLQFRRIEFLLELFALTFGALTQATSERNRQSRRSVLLKLASPGRYSLSLLKVFYADEHGLRISRLVLPRDLQDFLSSLARVGMRLDKAWHELHPRHGLILLLVPA